MAKQTLPTNFQDDIMNASMNGKRKYNLIQNTDGTVSLEDVTTYDQVGSNFGAGQINQINTAVNESADKNKILETLATISANTQSGYMAGALAVKELNDNLIPTGGEGDMNLADQVQSIYNTVVKEEIVSFTIPYFESSRTLSLVLEVQEFTILQIESIIITAHPNIRLRIFNSDTEEDLYSGTYEGSAALSNISLNISQVNKLTIWTYSTDGSASVKFKNIKMIK